jgi:hypothetical protein
MSRVAPQNSLPRGSTHAVFGTGRVIIGRADQSRSPAPKTPLRRMIRNEFLKPRKKNTIEEVDYTDALENR